MNILVLSITIKTTKELEMNQTNIIMVNRGTGLEFLGRLLLNMIMYTDTANKVVMEYADLSPVSLDSRNTNGVRNERTKVGKNTLIIRNNGLRLKWNVTVKVIPSLIMLAFCIYQEPLSDANVEFSLTIALILSTSCPWPVMYMRSLQVCWSKGNFLVSILHVLSNASI